MIAARVISIFIGYIFGMFVSGYILGKTQDVDIRKQGSGNIGTTNTMRILGIRMGLATLILDCSKCILATLAVWLLFRHSYPDHIALLRLYGAIGAVLGHDFPAFMKFKGGKGIACSFGMILAVYPRFLPLCVLVFAISVGLTKYVSLGSILSALCMAVQALVAYRYGWFPFAEGDCTEALVLTLMACVLAVVLHRANIKRLLSGTENKLSFKSKRE